MNTTYKFIDTDENQMIPAIDGPAYSARLYGAQFTSDSEGGTELILTVELS
jgi:hypothetical protein